MEASVSGPSTPRRHWRQKLRHRYASAREDAQVAGIIPTTPEGAIRQERVDPRLQGSALLPSIIRQALKENWSTPKEAKPAIVAALLKPFFSEDIVVDANGQQVRVEADPKLLLMCAKMLKELDQTQFERDHPIEAGQAKGGVIVQQSVQANMDAAAVIRELINDEGRGSKPLSAFAEPSPSGSCRFDGEVEVGAASTSH